MALGTDVEGTCYKSITYTQKNKPGAASYPYDYLPGLKLFQPYFDSRFYEDHI